MRLATGEETLPQRLESAYRLHAAQVLPFLHELPMVIGEKIGDLDRGFRGDHPPARLAERMCEVAYELLLASLLGMGE